MILIDSKEYNIEPYELENEFKDSVWNLRKYLFLDRFALLLSLCNLSIDIC